MKKYTVNVDGMACGMCESRVNEAVKAAFTVKEVESSHKDKVTRIISETELDEAKLIEVINATGFKAGTVSCEEYKKKGLFSLGKQREK